MTLAFVTKTYAPDLERCRLLCRSIELLAPEARHWIIVDARDRPVFRELERQSTRVVTTEDLLPRRIRRLELYGAGKNLWFGPRTPPVRGWLVQQLAKLAISGVATEDVLIHADSDVVLIRQFDGRTLADASGTGLFRVPAAVDGSMHDHVRWHRAAERLLALPARPLPLPDYIGGLVPWRRDLAVALLERIERRSGRDWMRTLTRERHLSEYILYGRFVDDGLGVDGGEGTGFSLCHCYWGSEPLTNSELDRFIDGAAAEEVGLMVSAKAGMRPADYAEVLERRWAAALRA
jgi:Family of unknown function (DUF6492)